MGLFGPKSKEYGDLNRKSITEIDKTVEKQEEELSEPFAGDKPGMVPASDDDTQAKFLRGDGAWATPAGGGGGTSDYEDLANKPAIDGNTLSKNSTAEGLGLAKKTDIPDTSGFVTDDDLKDYAKKTDIPSVPSKTSQLTNDSGFITGSDIPSIPSKTSQLINDSGFISQETDPTVPAWAKQPNPPTVPTKTSDLQNDSGFLTSESDPTVPSWAKQQNPPTPATFDGEHAGLVPAPASGDSGKYLKADGTWATPSGGGGGSSTLDGLTDVDLTNPSNGQILVYNATEGKWKNGAAPSGGGSGSIFKLATILPALYGTEVTITDEDGNTFTGTFDSVTGECTISGVDSIGDIVITCTNGMTKTINVPYFSKYGAVFGIQPMSNVSFDDAYGLAQLCIDNNMARLAGTVVHQISPGYNTWNSTSSDILGLDVSKMTSKYDSGDILGGTITQTQVGDGGSWTFKCNGYAVVSDVKNVGADGGTMAYMKNKGNIFNFLVVSANDTLTMNDTGNETKWVSFYPAL